MAPDWSCSLRTHSFWPVSHLRPPSASDTPWVALCYSTVTHSAFRPLPPPGTTPVLYPGPFGYQLTPHLPPNHRHCHPTIDSGVPVLAIPPTPVLPVVSWPAGLHRPSCFLSGSGSGLHTLIFDSNTPYYPYTSPACPAGFVSPVLKLFQPCKKLPGTGLDA
ncbi:hypothetical protein M404DRAFT_32709 [Pisolithus tinctorius Marx 270]|uniref:Uncharacterized protein n=1 Tax=Pisolithus tinctorius Marx 270 TaxID=870435 RepID=A0A0C3NMY6_PISTI|nr:hypothetical protein M404DRAFT_32709 [Pisolithus tinctorius Marx 270]